MSVNLALFPSEPYRSDLPVVPIGKEGDLWEYDEVVRYFAGKRPEEVTYESLRRHYRKDWTSAHHLMSDAAFAYFLPALMKLSQDNYGDSTDNAGLLADNLVYLFLRMARGEADHRLLPLLRSYTHAQLAVISRFLREMSEQHFAQMGENDEAAEALKLFWSRYG